MEQPLVSESILGIPRIDMTLTRVVKAIEPHTHRVYAGSRILRIVAQMADQSQPEVTVKSGLSSLVPEFITMFSRR